MAHTGAGGSRTIDVLCTRRSNVARIRQELDAHGREKALLYQARSSSGQDPAGQPLRTRSSRRSSRHPQAWPARRHRAGGVAIASRARYRHWPSRALCAVATAGQPPWPGVDLAWSLDSCSVPAPGTMPYILQQFLSTASKNGRGIFITDKHLSMCASSYLFIFSSTTVLVLSCPKYKKPPCFWGTDSHPRLRSTFLK